MYYTHFVKVKPHECDALFVQHSPYFHWSARKERPRNNVLFEFICTFRVGSNFRGPYSDGHMLSARWHTCPYSSNGSISHRALSAHTPARSRADLRAVSDAYAIFSWWAKLIFHLFNYMSRPRQLHIYNPFSYTTSVMMEGDTVASYYYNIV